ncbi:OLC1v1009473C1 [Oldenlandia corymbosa var. corymbosa]|uniref:OLC1v1009473C1 n=1 Tax=Oldenlandia corymbosa var. corymbosa TaxID=529605 RepID=A0AAV1DQK1_OLDCO|nr:OLC1v1009473C1 [Oldenlandia corymbosa var. corymbosa]
MAISTPFDSVFQLHDLDTPDDEQHRDDAPGIFLRQLLVPGFHPVYLLQFVLFGMLLLRVSPAATRPEITPEDPPGSCDLVLAFGATVFYGYFIHDDEADEKWDEKCCNGKATSGDSEMKFSGGYDEIVFQRV